MPNIVPPPLPEDLHQSSSIDCPKCRAGMKSILIGDVRIDRCYGCGGLWLDALEKDKLLGSKSAVKTADASDESRPASSSAKMLCPRDKSTMINIRDPRQLHVLFESCTVCGGIFLDAGELKDLSEITLRERLLGGRSSRT